MKKIKKFLLLFLLVFIQCTSFQPEYLSAQPNSNQTTEHKQSEFLLKRDLKSAPLLSLSTDPKDKTADPTALQAFDEVIKNTEKITGLFTLYRQQETGKVYLEIQPDQLNQSYLNMVTMESGLGGEGLIRGLPVNEFLFSFRRVNQTVQFVVSNLYFRAQNSEVRSRAINSSFSDSVLSSLPIKSIHPQRKSLLIDLGNLLLTDLPGFASILGSSYHIDSDKTYFRTIKSFPLNLEIESVYGFSGDSPPVEVPFLADSRSFNISVHYSLSKLPQNPAYRPRIADERIGYFITAYQDFSTDTATEPFVRYINRWDLEKQDPNAALSPPKKPIVFWIENTVPLEYREIFREGILAWNKAFEKVGFLNAIEARQMPNDAKWDAADVRYNVIRWSYSLAPTFLGIGISRVNPVTGEIVDADIVIDGNVVRLMKQGYHQLIEQKRANQHSFLFPNLANRCNLYGLPSLEQIISGATPDSFLDKTRIGSSAASSNLDPNFASQLVESGDICYTMNATNQFAFSAIALNILQNVTHDSNEMKTYINQYLRQLIAHEVGHTLGLRHNFHGSTLLKPEELNNLELTHAQGLVSSVMDYNGVNLAPIGVTQGDYFTNQIGIYDQWAIEYGYKPFPSANPIAQLSLLKEIADRSSQPELAYATDEDSVDFLDPMVNTFDLSSNILLYSQWQMDNAKEIWLRLAQYYPQTEESYSELREIFDFVLFYYYNQAMLITKYVGGELFNRDRAGSPNARLPFQLVSLSKQREALTVLQKYIFDEKAFVFSPDLLNKLAPSRWYHWGEFPTINPLDYPIGERIFLVQRIILRVLMLPERLSRLQDLELKNAPGEALTLPELFANLQQGIWSEVLSDNHQVIQIANFRRSIQREHLEILIGLVLRKIDAPADAETLARYQLGELSKAIDKKLLKHGKGADIYTKAHLDEVRDRINKVLNAQVQSG